ncbi:Nn.00g077260.m01.CDS01 [Neocucurbitaria sp. VM-36]
MSSPAEVQAATINTFIEGWKTKDPEKWTVNWTDDCTNTILPFSMKHPGWSKEDVEKVHLPRLFTTLSNWKLNVYEIIHDVAKAKACIYATSHADTPFGDFKWTNEYAAFLTLTEDGTKVKKIEEMVDTAFFAEMAKQGAAFGAAQAEKAKAAAAAKEGPTAQGVEASA